MGKKKSERWLKIFIEGFKFPTTPPLGTSFRFSNRMAYVLEAATGKEFEKLDWRLHVDGEPKPVVVRTGLGISPTTFTPRSHATAYPPKPKADEYAHLKD